MQTARIWIKRLAWFGLESLLVPIFLNRLFVCLFIEFTAKQGLPGILEACSTRKLTSKASFQTVARQSGDRTAVRRLDP